jgi:hypothetical protein
VAPTLQVRLQQQALHLAAFGLLLALDLVQGELQRGRGRPPSFQGRETGRRPGRGLHIPRELWNEAGGIGEAGPPKRSWSQRCGSSPLGYYGKP